MGLTCVSVNRSDDPMQLKVLLGQKASLNNAPPGILVNSVRAHMPP